MITKKETSDDLRWQMIQILDEINTLSASVEGTECLLLTMHETFRLSKRCLEDFTASVYAVYEIVGRHAERLNSIGNKIDAMIEKAKE